MAEAHKTSDAVADLLQIVDRISRDNLTAALVWLDQMENLFHLLATQPAMGEKVQTQRYGEVRRHVVGNYLIYYWAMGTSIEILRVVHGARDQGQAL
jgi:toxin ParE1/3/4